MSGDAVRRGLGVAALLALAALLAWWWWRPAPEATAATAARPGTAAAPRRVRVPRPPRPPPAPIETAAADPPPPDPAPADPTTEPDAAPPGPVDRREGAPPDGEALRELLAQQMDDVARAVQPCADAWAAEEPELDGRIVLRFGLDADGLQDVWIEEHDEVPGGVLDCFADAVYLGDWSGIAADPLEVSWPFHVTH